MRVCPGVRGVLGHHLGAGDPLSEGLWGPCLAFLGGFFFLLREWPWKRTCRGALGACVGRVGAPPHPGLPSSSSSWSSCAFPGRSDPDEPRDEGRRSLITVIYYFLCNGYYETWDLYQARLGICESRSIPVRAAQGMARWAQSHQATCRPGWKEGCRPD